MRAWLEQQLAYHRNQIDHFRGRRNRNLKEIRRRAIKTKKYNTQIKEAKKVMEGIEELISQEDWQA
jgi:ElaB/YqjD/DUF883 family membrane-anchored ribosome-binding protein